MNTAKKRSLGLSTLLLLCTTFFFSHEGLARALCVRGEKVNLRSGPGAHHPVSWVVGLYTPLVQLERRGVWLKVRDQDGEEHWVHHRLVTASQFRCLAVRSRIAELKTGPGARHPAAQLPIADKYTPFKRLGERGEWYHVEDTSGVKAWIHERHVWRPVVVQALEF